MEHVWMTVLGITIVFVATALGASVVYFFKGEISDKWNALFFGFASGVMLSASVWSLLLPAIEEAQTALKAWASLPIAAAFLFGGLFLSLLNKAVPMPSFGKGGKPARLFLAVTLHNVPEGLAVGFAFGAAQNGSAAAAISALILAIGIAVQNFPEGAAIALPMQTALKNRHKAFLWGAASGIVEPIFALLGFFLSTRLRFLQPWLLSLSAGAMVFVVAEDLIPDAKCESLPTLGAWGTVIGFALMMILDVALGG